MYPEPDKAAAPSTRANTGERRRVVVVGAGALGCATLRTLARDGRTDIVLVDFDDVELSNLQRQVLFTDGDCGRAKVEVAAARLKEEFGVTIETHGVRFDERNGAGLVAGADVVIDATDDPATKFLIARLSDEAGIASVYGGVVRTQGQWMLAVPGRSACLECVFPARDELSETAAGCAALGILAPVAGFVGAMQAITAITYLEDPDRAVAGRLHLYELTGARSRHIDFPVEETCRCRAARRDVCFGGRAAEAARQQHLEERRS